MKMKMGCLIFVLFCLLLKKTNKQKGAYSLKLHSISGEIT